MNYQTHITIANKLKDVRDALSNGQTEQALKDLDVTRSIMDDVLAEDHPDKEWQHVYFGKDRHQPNPTNEQ